MTKVDWFKRHFNFISSEAILQLQEKYPFKGFFIYELAMSLIGVNNEYSVKVNSTKHSFLIKSIAIHTDLPKQEIAEIFDFLLDSKVIFEIDNELIFPELKKSFDDFELNLQKKSNAGKKGADTRWKKDKLEKELPQYEGTFNHVPDNKKVDIVIQPKNEIVDGSGHTFKRLLDVPQAKHKKIFDEHFTKFFEFAPEYTYVKSRNKQEQKAFLYLMNIILDGDIDVLFADWIEDVICDSADGNPDFYISNLYTKLVNEYIKIRNEARTDIKDKQAERFCEKYKPLKEMPDFYY